MKKVIFINILLIFSLGLLNSAGIIVSSPNPGANWTAGSAYMIIWKCPGCSGGNVKINIFKNSVQQTNFLLQLTGKNTGRMNWKIPESFQTGKYILRVKEATGKKLGDSSVFIITGKRQPPQPVQTLSVKYPNGGEKLSKSYPSTITWDSAGMTGNANIELWKGNRKYGTIAGNVPLSQKMFKWKTGEMFGTPPAGAGSDYKIKIIVNGKEDMSNNFFSISDIPGIVNNQNNMFNDTYTFKNPPKQTFNLAVPPVIEDVKVVSYDKKYSGQVVYGLSFKVKVQLRNNTKAVMKNNWNVVIKFNKNTVDTILVRNAAINRKPGETWWEYSNLINTGNYNFIENKNAFHLITAILGKNKKSTMMGVVKKEDTILPKILSFKIWNNDCNCWSNKATHKAGTKYKVQMDVRNVYKFTIINKSTGKILVRANYPPNHNGEKEVTLTADDSGEIELTVDSVDNRYLTASVQLKTSGPLTVGPKFLTFDMWRSGNNIKTKGMVTGYKTVQLIEISNTGFENTLKELNAVMQQSSRLDWEFLSVHFPINLKLKVTYLDRSQEIITRTLR